MSDPFTLLQSRDLAAAEKSARETLLYDPLSETALFVLASVYRDTDRIDDCDALLSAHPDILRRNEGMASIWASLPRWRTDPIEDLRRAELLIRWMPQARKGHLHAIYAWSRLGLPGEAYRVLAECYARWPGDAMFVQAEGDVSLWWRDWQRALAAFDRLLAIEPGNGGARASRCRALAELGG